MESFEVRFRTSAEISPELDRQINMLDQQAFGMVDQPAEFASIQWSDHQWMALGFMQGELVSQLCIVDRVIQVGQSTMRVAGIGGVATAPQWQHKGFAGQLMNQTTPFLKNIVGAPFGLLICADSMEPFYANCGWRGVATTLNYQQSGQSFTLKTLVMALPLSQAQWPAGNIDVCGSPW